MKKFWHYLKQQSWLLIVPLLLATIYGNTTMAAQTASFSATGSHTTNNLTLSANVNIADADLGKNGNIYLGFLFKQTPYFSNGTSWAQFSGGALPVYATGPLANRSIEVVRDVDMSPLIGGQLFVGYGLSESDMLANNKYAMVYTVIADTLAPTVGATTIANNATGVDINTSIGATFSESMSLASINAATVTLLQGSTAIPGTVTYSGLDMRFVPTNALASNTRYTATIKGGVNGAKDLAGNVLTTDYAWSWTTANSSTADTTAPTLSGTGIANGTTGVSTNSNVLATFSEAMAPASINTATVILMQGNNPVAGTVSYSGRDVTFTPSNPLASNTNYTATIKGGSSGVKDLAGNALVADYVWAWSTGSTTAHQAPVLLGSAGNFVILAKTGVSTVPTSAITGDVGVSPAATSYLTGFSLTKVGTISATSPQVTGSLYGADMTPPTNTKLTTAVLDMQAAYTDAAGRPTPDFTNLGGGTIGGLTLAPGLYKWGSSVMITTDVTISGSANDVWIFQMSGDLLMSAAKRITLSGGAQAKNIFWQVAGQAIIGTTAHFEGIILSQTAISLQTGASMNGRALAQSMVALDSSTVTQPAP
jgi:hypothetical protein